MFHPIEDRERLREVVIFVSDLTTLFFLQLHDHAEKFWETAYMLHDLPEAFSAQCVKCLGQIHKGKVQSFVLLTAFHLELLEQEDRIDGAPVGSDAAPVLRKVTFCNNGYQSVEGNTC